MDSARIHLTDVAPPFCSACHNANPQGRHVDFDAVHEGPSFATGFETEVVGGGPTTSDQLVLCEKCVTTAAEALGLGDVTDAEQVAGELQERMDTMSDRLAAQAAHIDQLEKTAASRVAMDAVMAPGEATQGAPPAPMRKGATGRDGGRRPAGKPRTAA